MLVLARLMARALAFCDFVLVSTESRGHRRIRVVPTTQWGRLITQWPHLHKCALSNGYRPSIQSSWMLIALLTKQDRRNAQYLAVRVHLHPRDTQTGLRYRH